MQLLKSLFIIALLFPSPSLSDEIDQILGDLSRISAEYWPKVYQLKTASTGREDILKDRFESATNAQKLAISFVSASKSGEINALQNIVNLTDNKDQQLQQYACDALLALLENNTELGSDVRDRSVDLLTQKFNSVENDLYKVRVALTLYKLTYSLKARIKTRNIYKESDQKMVKDEAAIALAQMNLYPEVKRHLNELSKEPSDYGKVARNLIELENLKQDLSRLASNEGSKYDFSDLEQAIDVLKRYYYKPENVKIDDLVKNAVRAVCSSLDQYTVYMDEKDIQSLQEEHLEGKYGGIGAVVSMRKDRFGTRWLTIEEPIIGGSCYKANIKSGDKIIQIEDVETANKELRELVDLLRGEPATKVKVKVYSIRWDDPKEFELEREIIHLQIASHKILPGNIGYILLRNFSKNAVDLIKESIDSFSNNIEGLILDLRSNTGGYLDAAIDVADLFLDKGLLVVEKKSENEDTNKFVNEKFYTSKLKYTDVPLVILVNGGSASASEIIAGSLRDHKRATLIGETTFGKGSVQQILFLDRNKKDKAIKITIARWYLPTGESVQDEGVKPDITVEIPDPDLWKVREFDRLISLGAVDNYLNEHFNSNRELFIGLAEYDNFDHSRYPDFSKIYNELDTKLSKNEVRELIRGRLVLKVQDELGEKMFADYQADIQLQAAIREIAKKAGINLPSIEEYSIILAKLTDKEHFYDNK